MPELLATSGLVCARASNAIHDDERNDERETNRQADQRQDDDGLPERCIRLHNLHGCADDDGEKTQDRETDGREHHVRQNALEA